MVMTTVETKRCTRCGEHRPSTREFFSPNKGARSGLHSWCKSCACSDQKARHHKKREQDPNFDWHRHLLKMWGDVGVYDALVERQGALCGICGRTDPCTQTERFAVDHDHVTGAVRGLLCIQCNLALGQFGDNAETLIAAVAYLASPPCVDMGYAARRER